MLPSNFVLIRDADGAIWSKTKRGVECYCGNIQKRQQPRGTSTEFWADRVSRLRHH